jgi:hypothetical protein
MYEEEVKRGADWLDKHEPGWENRVNVGTLDVLSVDKCVLGQIGGWVGAIWAVVFKERFCRSHGFLLIEQADSDLSWGSFFSLGKRVRAGYTRLTAAWVAEIYERRAAHRAALKKEDAHV